MRASPSLRTFFLIIILIVASCQSDNVSPNLGDDSTHPLKINVKMLVGDILYDNIEATVVAKGFDAANQEVWSKQFPYAGPSDNIMAIKKGLDHYSVSMEKWGVTDVQHFTGQELTDHRADGPLPVTYVMGGKVPLLKKPSIVLVYLDGPNNPSLIQYRTTYQYNDAGRLERINYFEDYSSEPASQVISRYKVFSYSDTGENLSRLISYTGNNEKTAEDVYAYGASGNLVRIDESNYSAALTSSMSLSFDSPHQKATASYQYSNGAGFDYEFTDQYKNLVSDKTMQGNEFCSQGNYSYDRNINPFRHLGYFSYLVADGYSINNRLAEHVDYLACAFPSLIPVSYSYKYDELGYPTEQTTHYQGTTATITTKIFYRSFPQ